MKSINLKGSFLADGQECASSPCGQPWPSPPPSRTSSQAHSLHCTGQGILRHTPCTVQRGGGGGEGLMYFILPNCIERNRDLSLEAGCEEPVFDSLANLEMNLKGIESSLGTCSSRNE